MITCKICGLEVRTKRGMCNHIHTHGLSSQDYVNKYGDYRLLEKDPSLITCPICKRYNFNNLMSHVIKIHKLSYEEFNKTYPNYVCFTESYHNQCSNACKKSVTSQIKNQKKWSESRKKSAKTFDERYPGLRSEFAKNAHTNLSDQLKERWQDPEYRAKMSEKCKLQHQNGLTNIIIEKSGRKRYPYSGSVCCKMRSTWEVALASEFDKRDIKFYYEPFVIKYLNYENKKKNYYPDFFLPDFNLIIEVKPEGLQDSGTNLLKRLACEDKGYNYVYCSLNDINSFDEFWSSATEA